MSCWILPQTRKWASNKDEAGILASVDVCKYHALFTATRGSLPILPANLESRPLGSCNTVAP